MGDVAVLDSQDFVNPLGGDLDRNRPAVAASFREESTGGVFSVVVNHLKSKGSTCPEEVGVDPDPDPVDQVGSCNTVRTLAAGVQLDWLATDPTGSGSDKVLIVGDLNAYDKEDPIDVMLLGPDDTADTEDDYVDHLRYYGGEYAYSYLFGGQLGYLDYALANEALRW